MDIIMDIKGYLQSFLICKDIFFHSRYSRVYPFISFISSSSFINIQLFIHLYPAFYPSIYLFILIYPHLIQPFYPCRYLLSSNRPSQSNQAVDAHTARAPAPPDPIRAGGPDLRYQMGLRDTVTEQSLASRRGEASRRECVYGV
jgi:hypothetical protein